MLAASSVEKVVGVSRLFKFCLRPDTHGATYYPSLTTALVPTPYSEDTAKKRRRPASSDGDCLRDQGPKRSATGITAVRLISFNLGLRQYLGDREMSGEMDESQLALQHPDLVRHGP